ncbi:hypothetical protein D9611_003708 [Ephemerocybe angulata]|uniref:BTB domain-containing protein n=1 Tax=Ephemerocybe angulata TaxID=980116 RepID=A0A8H5B6E1_9AGAR|nr:hypothetical protein D9611_003708 [Tulosesus angulatus]
MNPNPKHSSASEQMTAITEPAGEKDEVYYWPNNVRFLVEGKLFRVSQYQFITGSQYFTEKYGLSTIADNDGPESVVQLPDVVSAAQFRVFLKMLFPVHTTSTTSSFTKDEWLTILELSVLWHFHDLRKLAIQHLDGTLGAIELVKVGRAAYVPRWVLAGYKALVIRQGIITEDEGDKIGNRTVNTLWIIRYLVEHHDLEGGVEKELEARFSGEFAILSLAESGHRTVLEIEASRAEEQRLLEEGRRVRAKEEEYERQRVEAVEAESERVDEVPRPHSTASTYEVGTLAEKDHTPDDYSQVMASEDVVIDADRPLFTLSSLPPPPQLPIAMQAPEAEVKPTEPEPAADKPGEDIQVPAVETTANVEEPKSAIADDNLSLGSPSAENRDAGTDMQSHFGDFTYEVGFVRFDDNKDDELRRSASLAKKALKAAKKKRAAAEAKEAKMQEELRLAEEAKREAELKAEKERKEEEEWQAVEAKAAAERARAEEERKTASLRNKADRPTIDLSSTPPPSKWGNANSRPSCPAVSRAPPASSGRLPLNARLGGQAAPKTWPQPPSATQPTSVFSLWK